MASDEPTAEEEAERVIAGRGETGVFEEFGSLPLSAYEFSSGG